VETQVPEQGGTVTRGNTIRLKIAYFKLKDHPYRAYERVQYEIDRDEKGGLYEAYVEDNDPKRIVFSRIMKPGQKIDFVFHRSGNARVSVVFNKKVIKVIKIDVEEND